MPPGPHSAMPKLVPFSYESKKACRLYAIRHSIWHYIIYLPLWFETKRPYSPIPRLFPWGIRWTQSLGGDEYPSQAQNPEGFAALFLT